MHIFVVEDDPIEALELKAVLEGLGHRQVDWFLDLDTAVAAAAGKAPDAVIVAHAAAMDFALATGTSRSLADRLRAPVVLVADETDPAEPGLAQACLRRPVTAGMLRDALLCGAPAS